MEDRGMAPASRRLSSAAFYSLVAVVVLALAAVAGVRQFGMNPAGVPGEARGGGATTEDNPEAQEQGEEVEEKHEAFERAVREGKAGQAQPIANAAAAGWAGEKLLDASADDWEPAIAADPNQPFVYLLATRYGSTKPCPGNCPTPYMALYVSSDGGATWSNGTPLCACKGSGQFDPIIEVVPAGTGVNAGAVYALYMNGFNVVFVKSTDHGAHWTAPVKTYGNVSWNDKPVIAMSNDGRDVYVSFNGPTGGDPYVAQSHDFGATWTQRKLVDSNRYYFAFDADVANDGTVYFAETSILYGGGGNKGTTPTAAIDEHVFVSTNGGATFTDRLVASVQPGLACVADGCPPDFYLGHTALSVDAAGKVMLLYDGATSAGGLQTISARSSTDKGATWSPAVTLSASGNEADAPAIEAGASGDFRAWYYQTTGANADAWNVYYRSTTDGGSTWSTAVKISDASSGASYKSASGFLEVYGDYGEIAITSAGKTIAIWAEGTSYAGPGGVWFNRQP
jgi:hypothetical protein